MTVALLVVGGGRMGEALLGGLIRSGWDPISLAVCERSAPRLTELTQRFTGVTCVDDPIPADGAVIAVKPADALAACRSLPEVGRVLSIAAGVTAATLESALPAGTPVVRAMPNTPALLGAGAAAIAAGTHATEADLAWAEEILGGVGLVVRVDEGLLDAVTGLSGSGPAYVFHLAEGLIAAGEAAGLPPEISRDLALQTILGAARMLLESGQSPAALRDAVTSPNGTTAAGLAVLAERGFTDALVAAVAAATERSRQLGQA
jgi:pyrroline-5-carboxylate reductase